MDQDRHDILMDEEIIIEHYEGDSERLLVDLFNIIYESNGTKDPYEILADMAHDIEHFHPESTVTFEEMMGGSGVSLEKHSKEIQLVGATAAIGCLFTYRNELGNALLEILAEHGLQGGLLLAVAAITWYVASDRALEQGRNQGINQGISATDASGWVVERQKRKAHYNKELADANASVQRATAMVQQYTTPPRVGP